ncbi:MAG: dockerin type I repeat-containing protein, partial [Candidatus Zixiibacteriota bacterium]
PGWLAVAGDSLIGIAPAAPAAVDFTVRVLDDYSYDEQLVHLMVYLCGDINNDGNCNILDITYLITYLYKSGPAPVTMNAADVNHSGDVNILDITYLIYYLYKSGPAPNCG